MPSRYVMVVWLAAVWGGCKERPVEEPPVGSPPVTAALVADLSPGTESSVPGNLLAVDGKVFFVANPVLDVDGEELWVSDGTEAGTFYMAPEHSELRVLTRLGNKAVFRNGPRWESALWMSDGTHAGTFQLQVGASEIDPVVWNGRLYFVGRDNRLWSNDGTPVGNVLLMDFGGQRLRGGSRMSAGAASVFFLLELPDLQVRELWKTDGTPAGTVRVKTMAGARGYAEGAGMVEVGGTLFFSSVGNDGGELWKSDGTEAGTVLVKGGSSRFWAPGILGAVGGTVLFTDLDEVFGQRLWRSDGTEAGTVPLQALGSASTPASSPEISGPPPALVLQGALFFVLGDEAGSFHVWRSDGTEAGTRVIRSFAERCSIERGPASTFFIQTARSLWRSDGTEAGTVLIRELFAAESLPPDSSVGVAIRPSSRTLAVVDGTIFFSARDGQHGQELWKSDGTAAGTVLVKDINTHPSGSSLRGAIGFQGGVAVTVRGANAPGGLWRSDGTAAGTFVLHPDVTASVAAAGETLLFQSRGTLWRSDGTAPGASPLERLSHRAVDAYAYSDVNALFAAHGRVYANAWRWNGTSYEREVWRSDGTADGTLPLVRGMSVMGAFALKEKTILRLGNSLWRTDGTEAGTVHLLNLRYPPRVANTLELRALNGQFLFDGWDTFPDPAWFHTVWRTDGTPEGTFSLLQPEPGMPPGVTRVEAAGARAFFFRGRGLWISDGTREGTRGLKEIVPAGSSSSGAWTPLGALGDRFFFAADDGVHGKEPWVSDGTEAGTVLLKDLHPDTSSFSSFLGLGAVKGGVLWVAHWGSGGSTRQELWVSDGTEAGTVLLEDFPSSSGLWPLRIVNGRLFFIADDGIHGRELWVSDGTDAGTRLVGDFNPGPAGSEPDSLDEVDYRDVPREEGEGKRFFFSADDGVHGRELWATEPLPL